jgi:tRNA nucleotidyltransferase (CCA-adding enzyme)
MRRDDPAAQSLEEQVLAELTPSSAEENALQALAHDLEAEADRRLAALRLGGKAAVQGSVAKGTWLRGGTDVDLFLLMDPSVPAVELEHVARRVAEGMLQDVRSKYAQHPYIVGRFRGHNVDLVPAYRVPQATARMTAVDRTPFHTEWVRAHLSPSQRADVRLLKRWMKGTETYGAQTATGGFSGYLVEVLVAHFRTFHGVLDWLAVDAQPRRNALVPDEVHDDVSPLVVVDPVDPARNCAAAVHADTLERAGAAARAYRARPDRRFYFAPPPRAEPPETLRTALGLAKATWTGLLVRPRTRRLDIVFPQFQRAGRTIEAAMAEHGFTPLRARVSASPDESEILFQWLSTGAPLAATAIHRGPPADLEANAAKFRSKWEPHPLRAGPVRQAPDGRLEVEVRTESREPGTWLRTNLPRLALGKHVAEALPGTVLEDPATVAEPWAPVVGTFVLDRRPWER